MAQNHNEVMRINFTKKLNVNVDITKYPMQPVELLLPLMHSKTSTSTLPASKPQAQQPSDLPSMSITSSHLPVHGTRPFTIYIWEIRKKKLQTCVSDYQFTTGIFFVR